MRSGGSDNSGRCIVLVGTGKLFNPVLNQIDMVNCMINLTGCSGQVLVFTFIFDITGDILMVSTDAYSISLIIRIEDTATSYPDLSK